MASSCPLDRRPLRNPANDGRQTTVVLAGRGIAVFGSSGVPGIAEARSCGRVYIQSDSRSTIDELFGGGRETNLTVGRTVAIKHEMRSHQAARGKDYNRSADGPDGPDRTACRTTRGTWQQTIHHADCCSASQLRQQRPRCRRVASEHADGGGGPRRPSSQRCSLRRGSHKPPVLASQCAEPFDPSLLASSFWRRISTTRRSSSRRHRLAHRRLRRWMTPQHRTGIQSADSTDTEVSIGLTRV